VWLLARVVGAVLVALIPAVAAAQVAGSQRIAIVDVQRVLASSTAGAAARQQLERDRAAAQKEMDGLRAELEKLRDELEKRGPLLTPDVRREREARLERKRLDAARRAEDLQAELKKKESALVQKALQDVSSLIDRVGKEQGYFIIVEKRSGGVLYAAPEADLTDEIIRAYNQQVGAQPPGTTKKP
jgi:outer membrane protein